MTRHVPLPGLPGKALALAAGAALLVLGFMFSLILIAVVAVLGLGFGAYVWWKMRAIREVLRQAPADGHVIEGEAVVVREERVVEGHVLPRDPPKA